MTAGMSNAPTATITTYIPAATSAGKISGSVTFHSSERDDAPLFLIAPEVAADKNRRLRRAMAQQDIRGFGEARLASRRARVVERDDEVRRGRCFKAGVDGFPRGQQIR